VHGFIEPVLLNKMDSTSHRSVEYLGVILDSKLTWRVHAKKEKNQ
jgi:hypothetical protein